MNEFSPEASQAIGNYVYALVDPRKRKHAPRRIFYVGKGIGQRCFAHASAEIKWKSATGPNPKLKLIRDIRQTTGSPPSILIIAHRLTDEESDRLEASLIALLQTDGNLVGGKYTADCNLSVDEIEGRYSRPLLESELGHRVLLVSLNGGEKLPPFPEIQDSDMPRRVLKYWQLSDRSANQVEYIAGVYRQLVRRVFKIKQAAEGRAIYSRVDRGPRRDGKPNWKRAFEGERSFEKELLWANRRIVSATGDVLTKFRRQVGCEMVGTHSSR